MVYTISEFALVLHLCGERFRQEANARFQEQAVCPLCTEERDAMGKAKQYRSSLMASTHETAERLHSAGVMDKRTLRESDELCLTPVQPLGTEEIRALRLREGASQAVFSRYLNVTTGLVSQWERGERRPQGASLKLLSLVAQKWLATVA